MSDENTSVSYKAPPLLHIFRFDVRNNYSICTFTLFNTMCKFLFLYIFNSHSPLHLIIILITLLIDDFQQDAPPRMASN